MFGRRILVTRAKEQSGELAVRLKELGGEVVEFPVIQIQSPTNEAVLKQLDEAIHRLANYDWIVFTSVNGVRYFNQRLEHNTVSIEQMRDAKVVAVGPKTAEALIAVGIKPELVAATYQQEGVLEAMLPHIRPGQSVLLPISNIARSFLSTKLREYGLQVTVVDVYENVPATEFGTEVIALLQGRAIDIITFTSSSTVTYLFAVLKQLGMEDPLRWLQFPIIACIGPLTAHTAEEAGLRVHYLAKEATVASLVEVLAGR